MSGEFKPIILTPRISRTLFIRALQYYFTDHPEYPWLADRSKTQIFIQDEIAEDAKHDSVIPTIVVENTGYSFQDDAIGANNAHVERYKQYSHITHSQYVVQAGINIHCLSQSSVDSEELAFEIGFFILSLKQHMHTMFNMQKISSPVQSKASNIEKDGWNYHYDSVLSFAYWMAIRSTHTPVDPGPVLAAIIVDITTPETDPEPVELDDGWVTRKIVVPGD